MDGNRGKESGSRGIKTLIILASQERERSEIWGTARLLISHDPGGRTATHCRL